MPGGTGLGSVDCVGGLQPEEGEDQCGQDGDRTWFNCGWSRTLVMKICASFDTVCEMLYISVKINLV